MKFYSDCLLTFSPQNRPKLAILSILLCLTPYDFIFCLRAVILYNVQYRAKVIWQSRLDPGENQGSRFDSLQIKRDSRHSILAKSSMQNIVRNLTEYTYISLEILRK